MERHHGPHHHAQLRTPAAPRGGEVQSLHVPLSGEVFELEEHLRQAYMGFAQGRSVMPVEVARASIAVGLAAERSWREGRPQDISLTP